MPATEDASPSRWQWLDWWFAPRWRALLTWIALVAFSVGVFNLLGLHGIVKLGLMPLDHLWPAAPLFFKVIIRSINLGLFLVWMEPIALRLNWWRGVAWIGLRVIPEISMNILWVGADWGWFWPSEGVEMLCTVCLVFVLRGWRSRPWVAFVAWLLWLFAVVKIHVPHLPGGIFAPHVIFRIPYAAMLLYGTRLLRPEERAAPVTRER